MVDWDTFELFPTEEGGGSSRRISMRVRLRMWNVPDGYENQGVQCLAAEADAPEELDAYIDELVAELQRLKVTARRKWKTG
jgi:hypothetical protein